MTFKDPQRKREYNREYARRKRSEAITRAASQVEESATSGPRAKGKTGPRKKRPIPLSRVPQVREVLSLLAHEANELAKSEIEIVTRVRATGYIAGVILKALELHEMEQRLAALEARLL